MSTTSLTVPRALSVETLIGSDVCSPDGECIGTIKEIMLDPSHGRIMYAVLSVGGFLGLGDKLFAVPWGALHLDPANERFLLNADKERLKKAEGFDKDAWPDFADPKFHHGVYSFYDVPQYWMT